MADHNRRKELEEYKADNMVDQMKDAWDSFLVKHDVGSFVGASKEEAEDRIRTRQIMRRNAESRAKMHK